MLLENVKLPAIQPFTSGYLNQDEKVLSFFHNGYDNQEAFNGRKKELQDRLFNRKDLADCIESYMKDLPAGEAVQQSLSKLRSDGLVVIGGQQAGLLTGPLYSIHKVISIIQLAKEQEKKLNTPVLPVFWIAGEDHDFLEINHVFIEADGQMNKKGYSEQITDKRMASSIEYDADTMKRWIRSVLRDFGETVHTKELLAKLDSAVDSATSFSKLFAYIIMDMFKEDGLLVIDAADPSLRKLEAPFFKNLLYQSEKLTQSVLEQQSKIKERNFRPLIDIAANAVNLFITIGNERVLLYKTEKGYSDRQGQVFFTNDDLIHIMESEPERFSNNVVTRPLMQEWLFPTLAFIAGPGEIAYWAELKSAFEKMEISMPPIVPRLSITLIERDVKQKIDELHMDLRDVLKQGTSSEREKFWNSVKDEKMDQFIDETERLLNQQYEKIHLKAGELHSGLLPIITKNLSIHQKQISFLKKKSDQYISLKHEVTLRKYDRVSTSLRPENGPQERIWNIFYFINRYGYEFVHSLTRIEYGFDHSHKVVFL